ncbi:hypothetical protein MUK42_23098 [Musa troglodytarum]|uniref:Uncharacterized protein n=1 Tax=Musa troglodytarum TaxID=320322 RepID=A0A9E7GIU4_9LILI|nr:hypothetical protein MUK42_23098 [Musa troglodytarum]
MPEEEDVRNGVAAQSARRKRGADATPRGQGSNERATDGGVTRSGGLIGLTPPASHCNLRRNYFPTRGSRRKQTSSPPSISIRQLSTPHASRADRRCSTVRTLVPSRERVVQRVESTTWPIAAGIPVRGRECPATKNLPSPAAAGRRRAVVKSPECSAVPDLDTDEARVCCGRPVCHGAQRRTLLRERYPQREKRKSGTNRIPGDGTGEAFKGSRTGGKEAAAVVAEKRRGHGQRDYVMMKP